VSVTVTYLLSYIVSKIGQIIGIIFTVESGPLFNTLVHSECLIQMCKIWPQETFKRHSIVWCKSHILNCSAVDRKCDRQMDGWMDRHFDSKCCTSLRCMANTHEMNKMALVQKKHARTHNKQTNLKLTLNLVDQLITGLCCFATQVLDCTKKYSTGKKLMLQQRWPTKYKTNTESHHPTTTVLRCNTVYNQHGSGCTKL